MYACHTTMHKFKAQSIGHSTAVPFTNTGFVVIHRSFEQRVNGIRAIAQTGHNFINVNNIYWSIHFGDQ